VGNFWPYAPKIFDYIKRAKRNQNDDYFSDQDVYSITGYILKINDLFEGEVIDKKKLSEIIMPNRDGFINLSN
jgi:cytochrome c